MEFIDYYKVLSIPKSASTDEVKKAYRKLARVHHPDLNPGNVDANKKFQQINEANEVLSDPNKRKKYDKYGKDWQHGEENEKTRQQYQQHYSSNQNDYNGYTFNDQMNSDFFSQMFGNSKKSNAPKYRGEDILANMQINLTDTLTTQKQEVKINNKTIRITIPAGIEDGQTLTLKDYGSAGENGGPNGNLLVTFKVNNNTQYKIMGRDLFLEKEISLTHAILGTEEIIETLNGKIKLTIKPIVQNNDKIRVAGKGLPFFKKENTFGDLYVAFKVILPKNITEEQKNLFKQFSNSL